MFKGNQSSRLLGLSFLGASSALAVACSGGSPAGNAGGDPAVLDAPNALLAPTTSTAPAFGDPSVAALVPMDAALARSVEPADLTATEAKAPGAKAYRIALVWGHLPLAHDADDADPEPTRQDWDGQLSVDAGAIGLARTLAFDANDHVEPRTDPRTLAFVSHTLPYVDGVLLRVVVPAGATPTLHFATTALHTDIDLSQLAAKVGGVQRLADDEEGLAWVGFPEDGCARGFVHGRWVKSHAAFGAMRGIVSDADGAAIGHVRGLWGHAPKRDADVFFAKIIDGDGDGKGLAIGRYGEGAFHGLWAAKDEGDTGAGTLEGFYADGDDRADGRGVWLGRWSEKCSP